MPQQQFGAAPQQQHYGMPQQQYGGMPQQQQQYGAPQQPYGAAPQQYGAAPQQYGGMPQQHGGMPQQQAYPGSMAQPAGMPGQPGLAVGGVRPIVGQDYCKPAEQLFIVNERVASMSGDDFDINDMHGRRAFTLDSSALSLSNSRTLKNAGGKAIASMKQKMLSSSKTWYINPPNGKEHLATIRKETITGQAVASVFLAGNTSNLFATGNPDITARGDFKAHSFWIYWRNQPMAEVNRQIHGALERFTSKNSYAVRVLPGMDAAFVVAFVTILDELFND
jgi:uncharacterized protein YxjI